MNNANDQVWFITGAAKGLGETMAKAALAKGYKVVASARNPSRAAQVFGSSPNLLVVELDVTNKAQIDAAVAKALSTYGRVDVLVNNAGYGQLGIFEEVSEKQLRKQMETNFFGTTNLTRALLPHMRKNGSGLIITVTSTSGIRAVSGGSAYSASKFAVAGWMEGLRYDLEPFGIKCMIVEPGGFRTSFLEEGTSAHFGDLQIPEYNAQREIVERHFREEHGTQPGDPEKFAVAVLKAANSENPPLHLVVGKHAVANIERYRAERKAEFDAWREIASDTNYPE